MRAGKICASNINAMGGWQGGRAARPTDFFPALAKSEKADTPVGHQRGDWRSIRDFLVDRTLASGGHVDPKILETMQAEAAAADMVDELGDLDDEDG